MPVRSRQLLVSLLALVTGLALALGLTAPVAAATPDPLPDRATPGASPSPGSEKAPAAKGDADAGANVAAADDPPDLSKFQKVVLGQGTGLGEVMELTVAPDGRVFFITRAGDISMYDPADGSIEIIMNNPSLGVWSGLEDGGLGITLDPDFADNGWVYVYYAPLPASHNANRLSRLTVETDGDGETSIDKASEKVILEVGTQRNVCCHSAGSVQFGDGGVLHLATGDNTSSSDNDGYSPHDERPGRSDYDAQKSSANTNDLRGKILRVIPRDDDAGDVDPKAGDGISYDIPEGNLFGEGDAYPSALYPDAPADKTRPEIYVMGLRNPYRLGVDADTDALYWGEVGPDSRVNSPNRGPRHFEEFNRTEVAMNGGWPYCGGEVGDDLTKMDFGGAYVDWDFVANRYRTNPDGSPKRFPCNDPQEMADVNDSPNSSGLQTLPPMTDAWIPYSDVAPYKYPAVQGSTPTGGQVYRQSQNTAAKDTAFPAHYEGSYFMSEMSRGWIKEVRMDAEGNVASVNDFMGGFVAPGDLEFGPDGSMYVLEYGTGFFSGSPQTKLVRIDYAINGSAPVARASADVTEGPAPLAVQFSSDGTSDPDGDDVTYAWDLDGDGQTDSTDADPSYTYDSAGDYTVVLTVTDSTGKSATSQVVVNVGNTAPTVQIELPVDGGFYASGDDIPFVVDVQDAEETVDCSEVVVQEGLGHDIHVHPNLSVNGCEGTIRTAASADHGPDANTYGVLIATYRDGGANDGANAPLQGSDTVILQPKLRQAEHATNRQGVGYTGYDDKSGTRPGGGGLITGMGNGDWVMFDPMSLANMTDVSIRYSGGPQAGATIQVRAGAADGPVVATVALDGGTQGQYFYKTVTAAITARDADAGGRPLYFVYSGNGEMNFDEFSVDGKGVAGNTSPVITSATATPADGLAPLEVDFAVEAEDPDGDDITYAWDFGVEGTDDDTADTATASWTYPEPGTYTATVTVEDSTGKSTSQAVEVTVRQPCATAPTPDEGFELLFDGTDVSAWKQAGPGGFTVENCALTSSGGLGLFWYSERTFDDYVVRLQFKLSDEGDNSGVFTRFPDPGNDPWVAVDNGHEIQIKEGQPNDEPQKTGSVYNFDREDDRNAKPIGEWNDYEIRVSGQTYTMTLNGKVVNEYTSDGSRGTGGYIGLQNHGDADEVSFRNIQVKELEVEEPFVNKLTADPVRGGAPLTVDFTAEGIDRQDDAITYEWDFGDGSAPVTGGAEVSHTYADGGTFTAEVTPVDADGNRGLTRTTEEITVLVDPVATATATPRCGVLPLDVDFDASATDPQDQSVTWTWDFGVDGTDDDTSTERSPTWTYTEAGEYTATVTATDPDGNTGTSTVRIEVLADGECRPVADLSELFNNDGISTDANPGDGNFDGGGWTFAAELLPQAVQQNGGPVRLNGVDYDFGSPADGQLNNVESDGQVITLPTGTYDELSILATAHNGDVQKEATLAYNDGTTVQVPLRFTDWAVTPKFGEEIAIDMPYRHNGGGNTSPRVMIFTQRIPLDAGKQPDTLTLPADPKLHVFGVSGVRGEEPAPPCEQPERSDEFDDAELLDNCHWTVRRPDETAYDVSDGALHLTARPGEYNDTANIITQDAPDGAWTATTKVTWDPTEAGQQAGLVVAGSGGSGFAKLTFVDKGNDNEWIEFLKSSSPSNNDFEFSGDWNTGGGSFDGPFLPGDFPTTFWLRFTSDGSQLRGWYSTDGEQFTEVGDPRTLAGITNPRVGVMALKGGAGGNPVADFDFFRWSGVEQGEAPTVTAAAEPTTGTSPLDVEFSAEGTDPEGGALTYAWDFGVGGTQDDTADTADASWTYTEPGTYTATVTVTDPEGQTGEDTVEVVVEEPAEGRTWVVDAVDSATDNQWVSEDNGTSTVTIEVGDTVEWQFDEATMGHDLTSLSTGTAWDPPLQEYRDPGGAPVRYTFTEPGTYEYWCSIHGATMRGTVVVEEPGADNQPPTANPLVDPRVGAAPLYVHFEARASDPDGDTLTYLWDFGQGDGPSDVSTSSHAHVTYAEPGRYTATLTVSDGKGGTYEDEFEIAVTGEAPRVSIEATPTSGSAPLPVAFDISAIDDQGGPLTYAWDFGDGTTYTGPKPPLNHVYTASGSYTATLTVTDPDGNKGSDSVEISVDALPEIDATATPDTGDAPLEVDFSTVVTTEGELSAFADGTATYPDLTGTASMVRSRDTTVTTLDVTGLKPNAAHMVHVHEQSCANGNGGAHFRFDTDQPFSEANEIWLPFTSKADGASGEVVVTSDQRAGSKAVALVIHDPDNPAKRIGCVDLDPSTDGLTYAWDFGDGEQAEGADPTHTYTEPGTYEATVTVSREGGTDEVTDTVQVVVGGDDPTDPTDPVASTVTARATPAEVTVGDTTKVAVEVTADGTTPSGQVTLSGGGKSYGPAALEGGTATFTAGPFTEPGTVELTASYAGSDEVAAGEGTVTVTVKAKPAPGDTTAPETTITDGPQGQGRGPAATFTFTSSEPGSTFECSLDGGAWAACGSPATFTRLGQGEHELRVRATDKAGSTDASPAARTWTVDRGKPTVKVLGRQATKDRTPTVRARLQDRYDNLRARDVKVLFGGRKAASVRVTRKGLLVATSRTLAPGRHRVVLVVRDEAGNKRVVRWWLTVRR
ncbi:PKD domain-containing protein [Nocardioides sp. STR2]|uniref:PKD domain-containing protein n=1 Tax=Nocardioides pini TaxID=2975053 RepID=A0ABT4CB46_9ACTN|nr:PKD domain-containing protein [Nocardioides pini]MCY4726180.1 PKD domain-containing protein [Nocardioides pini]